MNALENVIKELTNLPTTVYGGFYQLRITHDLRNKVIAMLKEPEEQKRKWLQNIADNQLSIGGADPLTEYEQGKWDGLQMAFEILTKER